MLARKEPVIRIAERSDVSRKFLYHQAAKADAALEKAFENKAGADDVLFYLPVTKKGLHPERIIADAGKGLRAGQALADTPRASSLIENLNSRLRNYFSLRKLIGSDYLDLLRFFLNHGTFMRSEHPERVGKSPAELLTGQKHLHWLQLLGFTPFCREAT